MKFEFKVTVHYGLWAKCTQLWPLKCVEAMWIYTSWVGIGHYESMQFSHFTIMCTAISWSCLYKFWLPWSTSIIQSPLDLHGRCQMIESLRITNVSGNINTNVKFLFKISAAWLVLNRNLTFLFMFPFIFIIRKLHYAENSPTKDSVWSIGLNTKFKGKTKSPPNMGRKKKLTLNMERRKKSPSSPKRQIFLEN